MKFFLSAGALLAIAVMTACSSSAEVSGGSGSGGASSSVSSNSGGGATTAQVGTTGVSGSTGVGGSDEGCGTGDCDVGLFCDFPYHACVFQYDHPSDSKYYGECKSSPAACSDEAPGPVCGCDGSVYASACAAYQAGFDIGHKACGPESTPVGHFACGTHYCDPTVEWCWIGEGDVGDIDYECRTLPAECGTDLDCACLEGQIQYESYCSIVEGNGVSGMSVLQPLI